MKPSWKRVAEGFFRSLHGRKTPLRYLGWNLEESRHYTRTKKKNSKKKTLRTHREGR